jgi:hypothetical protein
VGTGGAAGAGPGSGGRSGSGGGVGTGGGAGAGPGSGGRSGSGGGPGTGGAAGTGGRSGSGGIAGTGGGGGAPGTVESCFAGLRALTGTTQISTRVNAAEGVRLRLALETADRFGTSGTVPWGPVRLGLEIGGQLICLDEAALAQAYTGSHHNCMDSLAFDHGGQRYEIAPPDTSAERQVATLIVRSGNTVVRGPIQLTTSTCTGNLPAGTCRSGGPC